MKVIITREPNFRQQEYCILEFKGKFETEDLPTRSLAHLGTLDKVGDSQYRLEVGVMDIIGKETKLEEGWLYTETQDGHSRNQKIIVVKGIISRKILFDKRPCPNMERSDMQPKIGVANNLFKNLEIRGDKRQ